VNLAGVECGMDSVKERPLVPESFLGSGEDPLVPESFLGSGEDPLAPESFLGSGEDPLAPESFLGPSELRIHILIAVGGRIGYGSRKERRPGRDSGPSGVKAGTRIPTSG